MRPTSLRVHTFPFPISDYNFSIVNVHRHFPFPSCAGEVGAFPSLPFSSFPFSKETLPSISFHEGNALFPLFLFTLLSNLIYYSSTVNIIHVMTYDERGCVRVCLFPSSHHVLHFIEIRKLVSYHIISFVLYVVNHKSDWHAF